MKLYVRCDVNAQVSPGALYPGCRVRDMNESDPEVMLVEEVKSTDRGLYEVIFHDGTSAIYDSNDRFEILDDDESSLATYEAKILTIRDEYVWKADMFKSQKEAEKYFRDLVKRNKDFDRLIYVAKVS